MEVMACLVDRSGDVRGSFLAMTDALRMGLDAGLTERESVGMLAAYETLRPVFRVLFPAVAGRDPLFDGLDRVLDSLYASGLPTPVDDMGLSETVASVSWAAGVAVGAAERQDLVRIACGGFLDRLLGGDSSRLGMVFTPVEVVDAQLHMTDRLLGSLFGSSLADPRTQIFDGFAGAGVYMARLLGEGTLIPDGAARLRGLDGLHSLELVPFAALLARANAEQAAFGRAGSFGMMEGFRSADTFQLYEDGAEPWSPPSAGRSEPAGIRVVVGNPPYGSTDLERYPMLCDRIARTYAADTETKVKTSLFNMSPMALRWASDIIGGRGVVSMVMAAGWLHGLAGQGVRRTLLREFDSIHVVDLRGDRTYTALDHRRMVEEGDNIFDRSCRSPIAIVMLARHPGIDAGHDVVHYLECGGGLDLDAKKRFLRGVAEREPDWTLIRPDDHGDWLDQRDDTFRSFMPVVEEDGGRLPALFKVSSRGVRTGRDPWCYHTNKTTLRSNMRRIEKACRDLMRHGPDSPLAASPPAGDAGSMWTPRLLDRCRRGLAAPYDAAHVIRASYRPFLSEWLYMDPAYVDHRYRQPELFPSPDACNLVICVSGTTRADFSTLMTDHIPDAEYLRHCLCLPLYRYKEKDNGDGEQGGIERACAIGEETLAVFRTMYPGIRISGRDVFHYVYGILHSPEYRERFAANLRKEPPRIPLTRDFAAFAQAGRELARLHVGYEDARPWPVTVTGDPKDPGRFVHNRHPLGARSPETGHREPDVTVLRITQRLSITGIPARAHEYRINGGSVIDRFVNQCVSISGRRKEEPADAEQLRRVLRLVPKLVRVSMRTLDIMDGMPPLDETAHPRRTVGNRPAGPEGNQLRFST